MPSPLRWPMPPELAGRRVLFVDAIRDDVASGGRTATRTLARRWSSRCELTTLHMAPRLTGERSLGRRLHAAMLALVHLPASAFVALYRLTRWPWLEFFSRLSLVYLVACLWLRWRTRPEAVVLNHHSAFIYLPLFIGVPVHLVWHDVPSRKRDPSRPRHAARADSRCSARLERMALRQAAASLTYSFTESRFLRRLHGSDGEVAAAIDAAAAAQAPPLIAGRWLMVGNWSRAENADGAREFFARWTSHEGARSAATFCVAGAHADRFVDRLLGELASAPAVSARPDFGTLDEFGGSVLLAPIRSGAGIKLKTLEAWAAGIPVVGTAQAFSGLPAEVWQAGGLRLGSIAEMAAFASRAPAQSGPALSALRPLEAYRRYRNLTQGA